MMFSGIDLLDVSERRGSTVDRWWNTSQLQTENSGHWSLWDVVSTDLCMTTMMIMMMYNHYSP